MLCRGVRAEGGTPPAGYLHASWAAISRMIAQKSSESVLRENVETRINPSG